MKQNETGTCNAGGWDRGSMRDYKINLYLQLNSLCQRGATDQAFRTYSKARAENQQESELTKDDRLHENSCYSA